jgi:hypothetical protein
MTTIYKFVNNSQTIWTYIYQDPPRWRDEFTMHEFKEGLALYDDMIERKMITEQTPQVEIPVTDNETFTLQELLRMFDYYENIYNGEQRAEAISEALQNIIINWSKKYLTDRGVKVLDYFMWT